MSSHHDRSHDRTPSKSHSHSKKHKSKRREAESLQERIKAFGYSNTDNPFNDPHLDEPFVWKLKEAESSRTSRSRQKELGTVVNAARQLEALVKQRRKREDVRQRKNEEYQKPVMRGDDWAVKEDQFHLDQIMERAAIRMRQDRPLPIDKICMPFCILQDPALGVELGRWCLDIIEMPPYELLDALNDTDLETVGKDVHSFVEFGKRGPELDFWIEMETVIKAITTKRQMQMQGAARIGVTASVAHDIDTMLEPKSFEQLIVLEEQILAKLNGIGGPIDVDYWEAVMDALVVWKAKSMIRAMHGVRYRQVVDLVEPMLKNQVRKDNDKQETVGPSKIEQVFLKEAAKSVEKDEQPFLNPPDKVPFVYLPWHAKLAPIEPRYYNRVYLGYEWNAHNQLHYTQDNPPPKVVRGYKFNLFYPDLVNNQLAPRYRVEPDIRDKARLLVRFSAGPPYVDVVFGIEDRGEWEVQRGFKSSFEKGVLSLWFRFKKDFRR